MHNDSSNDSNSLIAILRALVVALVDANRIFGVAHGDTFAPIALVLFSQIGWSSFFGNIGTWINNSHTTPIREARHNYCVDLL